LAREKVYIVFVAIPSFLNALILLPVYRRTLNCLSIQVFRIWFRSELTNSHFCLQIQDSFFVFISMADYDYSRLQFQWRHYL